MKRTRTAIVFLFGSAIAACSGASSAPATGNLSITVSGLPGVPAVITVSGVDGFNKGVTGTTTLTDLPTGSYIVSASNAASATATYRPVPAATTVEVTTSGASAAVSYQLASGSLALSVSGLPSGLSPSIQLIGPGVTRVITTPGTVGNLLAGEYTVVGSTVAVGSTTYGGTPFMQTIPVPASDSPASAAVAYSVMTGQIPVTISGLPGGSNPSVLVTGPFTYSHAIATNGTTTLSPLPLGDYSVAADSVVVGPATYFPLFAAQVASLNGGTLNAPTAVTYAVPDLSIDGMYITQATQTYAGAVPLVANRDGYLRVFVKADHGNHLAPPVRVRWYMSGVVVRTDTIPAPTASVPQIIDESTLNSSWNLAVPGALLQPGLQIVADVDPSNAVVEGDETNNKFPVSGVPLALDVRVVPPAKVMLVPVMTPDGRVGAVNSGNMGTFMTFMQKVHPLPGYVDTLHATYTTSTGPLRADDRNHAWTTILSELAALRTADNAPADQHYYGVVHPVYNSGLAGLAFVGEPTAMGWDQGINDQVLAHEIGHNWGRNHAPCGSPSGVDPSYPYSGASIGAYGFDVATKTLIAPWTSFDVMSYCRPYWVSDYTYEGVLAFRAVSPDLVSPPRADEPVLLVWGRMHGSEMVLEPAFEIMARAKVPTGSGAYRIEALDARGTPLFSYAFDGQEVADEPGGARTFAFAIPLSRFDITRLAALELAGGGRTVRVSGTAPAASGLRAQLSARRAELMWDHASYPMALVRDAHTGRILSFARGGFVRLGAPATDLVVTVSNGVRSTTETVRAQ